MMLEQFCPSESIPYVKNHIRQQGINLPEPVVRELFIEP